MSKTKYVTIGERTVGVFDNSHDIVVARMVEAAGGTGIEPARVADWREVCSISDIALTIEACTDAERAALAVVLSRARAAIEAHGDVVRSELVGWSVLPGVDVSDGFLRVDTLPVAALLDVVAGFDDLIANRLAPDPPGGSWMLGFPGGRTTDVRGVVNGQGRVEIMLTNLSSSVEVANLLERWDGSDGRILQLHPSLVRLALQLSRPGEHRALYIVGVGCVHLTGPVHWSGSRVEIHPSVPVGPELQDKYQSLDQIVDRGAGLRVLCSGFVLFEAAINGFDLCEFSLPSEGR